MTDFEMLIELMHPFICIMLFILGTVMGSFLECLADRHAHGKSIVQKEHSYCPSCGHELHAPDLIPVLSWIFLRGKCRYCKAKIPSRHLICELLLGTGYLAIYLIYGFTWDSLRGIVLLSMLLPSAVADLETMEVPDVYWIIGSVFYVITAPFTYISFTDSVLPALLGALAVPLGIMLVSLLLEKVLGRETLGGADIKLLFITGLYLGGARSLINVIVMCFIGLIMLKALKTAKGKEFPLVPAIALSTGLTYLFGSFVLNWYFGLFGLNA